MNSISFLACLSSLLAAATCVPFRTESLLGPTDYFPPRGERAIFPSQSPTYGLFPNIGGQNVISDPFGFTNQRSEERCDPVKLRNVINDHMECYRKAEKMMVDTIVTNNEQEMFTGLCDVIKAKIECIETFAPKCLNKDQVETMKINFINGEIKRAEQNPDLLGDDFIHSCMELNEYQSKSESDVLMENFGESKCSFEEALNKTTELEACKVEAMKLKHQRESMAVDFLRNLDTDEKSEALNKIYCDFKIDWMTCFENTVFMCASEDKKKKIMEGEEDDFEKIEDNFSMLGIKMSLKDCKPSS